MTAFDSPLLVSKAVWLYARPADRQARRPLSDGQQRLLTLLEGRRRRYLVRKEESIKIHKKREGGGDESTSLQQTPTVRALDVSASDQDTVEIQRSESLRFEEMTTPPLALRGRMRDEIRSEEMSKSLLEPTGLSAQSTPKKAERDLCAGEVGVLQRYGEHHYELLLFTISHASMHNIDKTTSNQSSF